MFPKFLIFILFISLDNILADYSSLYAGDDSGVVELNASNVESILSSSPHPFMVNFYASWCGHCRSFAPIYKSFQKEIQNWGMYVAAMNCANPKNSKICRKFEVDSYPMLKLFKCNKKDSPNGIDVTDIGGSRTINSLRMISSSFLMNTSNCPQRTQSSYNFDIPFWASFKSGNTAYDYLVIVIGSPKDIGVVDSLALDLQLCLRIYVTMIDIKNTELIDRFGSFSKPSVIAVDKQVNIKLLSNNPQSYTQLRQEVVSFFEKGCPSLISLKMILSGNSSKTVILLDPNLSLNNMEIYIDDMIKGIGMTFRDEIPRKLLNRAETSIVHNWIDTIRECMHLTHAQADFLDLTKQWLQSQGDVLQIPQWESFMRSKDALSAFPIDLKWKTCAGSSPLYRGFPCSLWLTFHVMTVKCENASKNLHLASKDVLLNIRAYILNFFGCTVCRTHFKDLTHNVPSAVKTSEDGILFLWNGHNYVNARLRSDDSSDPLAPKIQFPSVSLCSECRDIKDLNSKQIFLSAPGYGEPPVKWNRASVLNFLRTHYGADNIRISDTNTNILDGDLYDPSVEFIKSIEAKRR